MFDSSMSVVLPIEKADEFMDLFYPNNMDGFNVEERDEIESYDNEHGLAFRCISFQPRIGLMDDIVMGLGTCEKSLETVCREYGVKRLTMYRVDGHYEEYVTFDKKNGLKYQDRDGFPMPEDDALGDDETLEESEAEAG